MGYNERWNNRLAWLAVLWAVILLWGLLAGCAGKRVTLREITHDTLVVHHSDTVRQVTWRADTVRLHDSVTVTLKESGETIRVALYRDRWRDRWHRDTVRVARTDTVYKSVTAEQSKEVKREPGWLRVLMTGWPLVLIALFLWFLRWLRRHSIKV